MLVLSLDWLAAQVCCLCSSACEPCRQHPRGVQRRHAGPAGGGRHCERGRAQPGHAAGVPQGEQVAAAVQVAGGRPLGFALTGWLPNRALACICLLRAELAHHFSMGAE